ncbi:hypothetical protein [Geodermatophilus sp. DSM 44513]|uniref:hypothetical protein n=1 Tax=Geodermatophilus sp. DSM 44513 TaxID=1528104 RepID=UPI0012832044|nr:hypothetical protein [Geodermatophilus sp. DSM 44513]WNV73856.1 hypothetical protein RTG05_12765 [Geodermatophilus sp. DSM 44513]
MQSSGGPLPWRDRPWGDIHRAWPLVLEPTGLAQPTRPRLGGASSPASVRLGPGSRVDVEWRSALALLRVPVADPSGRPGSHLAWVLLRGATERSDVGSQVSGWWPTDLGESTGTLALSLGGEPPLPVAVHGDDRRWATAPVQVPATVLPGEPTTLVVAGRRWPVPPALTMQAAPVVGAYLDTLR